MQLGAGILVIFNWAHLGVNWPQRETERERGRERERERERRTRLGNEELAGSQITKHSAPDSQLGQMAELQHDGTNMHQDGRGRGGTTHTHTHTHTHTAVPQCSLRRVANKLSVSQGLKSLYETCDWTRDVGSRNTAKTAVGGPSHGAGGESHSVHRPARFARTWRCERFLVFFFKCGERHA